MYLGHKSNFNKSLVCLFFFLTHILFPPSITFCFTLFQIAVKCLFYFRPLEFVQILKRWAWTFRICKNMRGSKYIGVIYKMHPQKQPILQIHTDSGTAPHSNLLSALCFSPSPTGLLSPGHVSQESTNCPNSSKN